MTQFVIPQEQWAQVVEKSGGPPVYKKIPVQNPGPDEVLINIKYSGVCHTDLHALKGDWPLDRKMPLVGGHEGAGIVVAKGSLVTDIEIGDHAGIKWLNGSCLSCAFCMEGDEPLCPHALLSGYTVDGTFQQYAIGKAAHVARLPKDLDLAAVAPVLCAGITAYKGLKESNTRAGQYVAIVGAGGGLGSLALQYAKAMGLHTIAIDGGAEKGKFCKSLGAAAYVDFTTSKDLVAEVKAATPGGLGPHAVILLAVQEGPFQQATEYVRSHGAVVCIGMPAGAYLKAPVFDTVVRMINIKGSYVGNRLDTYEAIEFFRQGLIQAPFKIAPLSELPEIFKKMDAGTIVGRYVVDTIASPVSQEHLHWPIYVASISKIKDISEEITELTIKTKNPKRLVIKVSQQGKEDHNDVDHEIIKVTLNDGGEQYILDFFSAPYGYHEPIIQYKQYYCLRI